MAIKRIALSLIATGACAGGCVAVAVGDDATPPPAAAPSTDAGTAFAVFRRAPDAGDQMPPETRRILSVVMAREGVDADRARAVAPSAGRAVWAIPGWDKVCLAIPDPVDGFGINCGDIAAAKSGRLWVTLVGLPGQRAGDVRIALFVPDGVDEVVAVSAGGASRSIATSGNVGFADLSDAGSVGFSDEFGEHRVAVAGTPEALVSDAK